MNTERLSLERVPGSPPDISQQDLGALALLYARVFAGEPWNEYTACRTDGEYFGNDTRPGELCPRTGCEATLDLAYPPVQTAAYITDELERPDAALLLLRDGGNENKIVGFSWGFSYEDPEAFAEDKYKTPEMRVAISGLLLRRNIGASGLWYLSESGIEDDEQYRGQGWSGAFHAERLEVARSLGLDAVQRTDCSGNMYRTSVRTMTQIMGPEAAVATTGKLQPTGRIVNDLVDTENPSRVLFALRQEDN